MFLDTCTTALFSSPARPWLRRGTTLAAAAALLLALAPAVHAQNRTAEQGDSVYSVDPVIVTATRGPRPLSDTPRPALVLQRRDLSEQMPNSVSDLFRMQPGLDVTGVGISQVRPQIRGQGGQRILLLADGLRMNNTRRKNDFGELPALVDLGAIEQVEVLRGPASVLYGSAGGQSPVECVRTLKELGVGRRLADVQRRLEKAAGDDRLTALLLQEKIELLQKKPERLPGQES
jgi:outer membrane receptor protein involved in Fe transport